MKFAFLIDVILIIIFEILALSYRGDTQATGCGGTFRGPSGTISSPNFPSQYPPNLNCSYYIELSQQYSVNITFLNFSTEPCCDWLQVFCSVGSIRSSQRFSGQNSPPFLSIGSCSRVTILFFTDTSTAERGFSLRYNIGDGIAGGLSLKPSNAFVQSPNGNVVLGCTSNVKRPDAYPCWFFSQDGLSFKQITTPSCSVSSQESSTLYRTALKNPPGACNLTVLTNFLSSVTGLYTCTDSTLDSASAVLLVLSPPTLTSVPNLNLPTTEVVQDDSFTVTCSAAAQQPQPRFAQTLLRLYSTEFDVKSNRSLSRSVTARPTLLPGCVCEVLVTGLPDGCDTGQPNGLSVSIPDRQVSFWPDAQNMTITGASEGKAKTNTALVCYAPSYPSSTYHWTSIVTEARTEGSIVLVTHSGMYTCTAEYLIRGRTYQASKSIDITIDDSSVSDNVALIVGVVLGAAVFVLIVILIVTCVCLFMKIRKSPPASKYSDTTTTTTTTITTAASSNQTPYQIGRPSAVNGQVARNPENYYTGRAALEMAGYDNNGFITEQYERPPRHYQHRN